MREPTEKEWDRYYDAAHAVQAGTKVVCSNYSPEALDCRIGLNVVMSEFAGFTKLLISKGIITETEFYAAIADGCEAEKARLEEQISNILGGTKTNLV